MRLSDGAVIPGNADHDRTEREHRLETYYRPYHRAVDAAIERGIASGMAPMISSIHSFTPVWRGVPRRWHAGILWDNDPRLAIPLIEGLRTETGLQIGDNEPYRGYLKNDTLYFHGTKRGLAHALIEIRQDLIDNPAGVEYWAEKLKRVILDVRGKPELHEIRRFGSRTDPQ